jgi:branched-chain amino acid transport system ATP-binding protein
MSILRTRELTKRFGGVTAVDSVDFELGDELCALIGPNGAGKTTFFNCLTGALTPTDGTVELRERSVSGDPEGGSTERGDWRDLTGAAPHETAAAGMHRSFQITNVFPTNTVLENVRIAAQAEGTASLRPWRNVRSFPEHFEEAWSILDRVGLSDQAHSQAGTLSHGAKRQLEVGIALAGDPEVVLMDEPAAGVSSESVDDVVALIEDVATDHAVLLVEHNMDLVMDVSERIVVLHQGELIADDDPEAVRTDPAVREAYLGGYERGSVGADDGEEGTPA